MPRPILFPIRDAGAIATSSSRQLGSPRLIRRQPLVVAAPSRYVKEVLADNPISYWRMHETGGTVAADEMSVNVGTYTNVPTFNVGGPFNDGRAVLYAVNESVSFADSSSLALANGPFTIEAWVSRTTIGAIDSIFSKNTGAYYFRISTTNKLNLLRSAEADLKSSTASVLADGWHHVVVTYAGSNGEVWFYIDGVPENAGVATANFVNNGFGGWIGEDRGVEFMDGSMGEVAIYGTALPPIRILRHYQAGRGISGAEHLNDLSGGLTFVGALTNRTNKALSGGLTFVGALTNRTLKALSGGLTFSGNLTALKLATIAFNAALTFSGSLARGTNKALSGGLTFGGNLGLMTSRALSGSLSFSANLTKLPQKALSGAVTFSGSLTSQTRKALSGGLTFVGGLTKRISRSLSGGLTFSGSLTRSIVFLKSFAASLTFSGSLGSSIVAPLLIAGSALVEAYRGRSRYPWYRGLRHRNRK